MTHSFMGTITNKLDKKGRISVPASFRAELEGLDTDELVARPSQMGACIEVMPKAAHNAQVAQLRSMQGYSPQQRAFLIMLMGSSVILRPDAEGRILLPAKFIAKANLSDEAAFRGMGDFFEIWEPAACEADTEDAISLAAANGFTLPPLVTS